LKRRQGARNGAPNLGSRNITRRGVITIALRPGLDYLCSKLGDIEADEDAQGQKDPSSMRSSAEIRIGSIRLHHSKIIPPPEHTVNDEQANAFLREAEELEKVSGTKSRIGS
jgi:hypothetical protein